jgi:hypothetical protein
MSLVALATAVEQMADRMMAIDGGGVFSGMSCWEAESIATVLALAGRMDAAAHVIMMHGQSDTEGPSDDDGFGDAHHDVYEALEREDSSLSHDEADEPFRLAMAHVRELV